ncbi:hypothetical protein DERP_003779 [Dermatophagoides pteronyssinus]|uniref:Uncharacterized protein n=1 Tax=Dermatophagoides pteronyssinus TaxID=6956 RepID=A0ABQ8JLL2_DERPT|nr:hypothetical protein DERP_003779 [Dermatophagoides pteronyssinus]
MFSEVKHSGIGDCSLFKSTLSSTTIIINHSDLLNHFVFGNASIIRFSSNISKNDLADCFALFFISDGLSVGIFSWLLPLSPFKSLPICLLSEFFRTSFDGDEC